jgi:hypothetical protein
MRFMLLMIPGVTEDRWTPSADEVAEMMAYNEQLTKAGVLLALDGLLPSSNGARIQLDNGKKTVTDGPFTEAKELIGGYWVIQAKSREEAVEWAKRCPLGESEVLEVRQIAEWEDFPEDVQAVARRSELPARQTTASSRWEARPRPTAPSRPSGGSSRRG